MAMIKKTSDFAASYKLSCILFLLLLLLTYLGTMHQVDHGLYQSQQKYFESLYLVHWAFDAIPIPLPGGYLVMSLMFINLSWGVLVRFSLSWKRAGMLIAHAGILVLLAGALIAYLFSISGHMVLYEGEESDLFESSYEWELGVGQGDGAAARAEYIIHQADFAPLKAGKSRTFHFAQLPFDLDVTGYEPNAKLGGAQAGGTPKAGENMLMSLPLEREYEQNMAGLRATVIDKQSGARQPAIVWAGSAAPTTVTVDGKQWDLVLRKRQWPLAFSLKLDRFDRKLHPGTQKPREFSSYITKTEDGVSQQAVITMNEPFRRHGYTFYQSSWGPQNGGPDTRLYSVLSVVKNPADKMPLYACVITTLGLILHFGRKLLSYLRKEKAAKS